MIEPGADTSIGTSVWRMFTGTTTKYVLLAINIGLGAFLMPFTLRHLGRSEYGLWMLVASMTYYFQLLDLGYGNGLVRHLAHADAQNDTARANQIASTFVIVYAALGLAAGAGIVAIMFWIVPRFPHLDPGQIRRAQLLLAIMGVRVTVGFPMTVFGAVTTARQRFALNNTVAIGVAIANAVITYVVLTLGFGLLTLVASTTAIGLASYAAYAWTARLAFPALKIRARSFSRALVGEVTTYSVYVFLIDIAVQIGFNLDNVVVGAALGTTAVAVYAVTLRLADYQRQLCSQFNGLLFPVVVRFNSTRLQQALRDMVIEATRITLTLVIGVTICLIGFGRQLIAAWLGPGFDGSVVPLYVLALAGVILVGWGPLGNVLMGTGRHRLVAFIALAEAISNLVLSVFLVRRYGIVGVAVGTAIPVFMFNLFVLLPAACRQIAIGIAEFCRLVALPPLAGVLPSVLAVALLHREWPADSVAVVVLQGAIVGLAYLASVYALGLPTMVRRRYVVFLRRLLARSLVPSIGIAEI
jgi:O-antigen/teichoic acid export membrane protein